MKIVVIGDTHDNIANIKHVMGFARKIKAGAVIHAGDWNSLKAYETVKSYGIKIYGVLGNADISPDIKSKFKTFLRLKIDGIKIGVVHNSIKYNNVFDNLDIIFTGHFHTQKAWEVMDYAQNKKIKMIRVGNLENNINFAVFDTKKLEVELIDNEKI